MKNILYVLTAILVGHIVYGSDAESKVVQVLSKLAADEIIDTLKSYESLLKSNDSSLSAEKRKKIEVLMIYHSQDLVEIRERLAKSKSSEKTKQKNINKNSDSIEALQADYVRQLIKEFNTDIKLCKQQLKNLEAIYSFSK